MRPKKSRGWCKRLAAGFSLLATPVLGDVTLEDYETLARVLDGRVGFGRLPRRDEPGVALDSFYRSPGVSLGEHFAGQNVLAREVFDSVEAIPVEAPLTLKSGPPRQNLNVAWHRGFGSNAVFPVGPLGFPNADARGEGMLSALFDADQQAVGFRVHTDYPDAFGSKQPPQDNLRVLFFARDGRVIGELALSAPISASAHGFVAPPGPPGIAGMTILNTDPGGVALDDFIYQRRPLLF